MRGHAGGLSGFGVCAECVALEQTSVESQSQKIGIALARNGHHFTIGKTMQGMSAVPSKLSAHP
jgi:hypothetical protein